MSDNLNIAKENTLIGKIFYIIFGGIFRPLVRLIWVREVRGLENFPIEGPCIVAANHQSYLDFIVLVAILPRRLTFLAAEKFFYRPTSRFIMEYSGQIRVDRELKDKEATMRSGLAVLHDGRVLALFPQGTRSRTGEIDKFYPGVAKFSIQAQVPVIPIGISGAFKAWPPHEKKPKFKKIIDVNIGEAMNFNDYHDSEATADDFQEVTNLVMREITRLAGKEFEKKD